MGSIAIDPVNPEIIYAGTGEQHFSGDSYYGCGVLRSINGGITWEQLGSDVFQRQGSGGTHISRVFIDPRSVLRVEGPSVDSVQAGPDLVAYQVSLPNGVHAFVANPIAGVRLDRSDVLLRFWSEDISELHNYVATVEQAAATTYDQIPVESVLLAVAR